jgi:NDP-sugar pyrophosphorylase family protein
MQALILAGGKGTRLHPYTSVLPKPLMPVGDYPILEIILRQLKKAGVNEVILAVGYMSQLFQAFFENGARYGLKMTYSFEEKPLGTAGPIAIAFDRLEDDFMVMNGDLLTTLHFERLFLFHKEMKAAATIGLYRREVKIDFGVVESNAEKRLVRYIEKPTYQFEVSMGVYAFNKEVVGRYLTMGEYLDFPDLMVKLLNDGRAVYCYQEPCYWLDIGRMEDYQIATEVLESNKTEFLPDME